MVDNVYTRVRHRGKSVSDEGTGVEYYNGTPTRHKYIGFLSEVTKDHNNHFPTWLAVNASAPWTSVWDVGGPFENVKSRVEFGGDNVSLRYFPYQGDYLFRYKGLLVPGVVPGPEFSYSNMSNSLWNPTTFDYSDTAALDQFGAEAIAATIPNAPHADVFQQLEEIRREGLPKIPGLQFLKDKGIRGLAGEHLNYQFGVLPTVSAIREDAEAIKNAAEILKQYHRDSGRLVRRRLVVPKETTTTTEVWSTTTYPLNTVAGYFNARGPVYRIVETTRKRWFSGAYRYFAPIDPTPLDKFLDDANILLGIDITPEKMFALAPWSWMLDWFTNSGEMLTAIQTFRQDPMLLRWGYVMEHMKRTTTYEQDLVTNTGASVKARLTLIQERKMRRKATPFGFGLSEEELTTKQKSILAALGISKLL